MSRVAATRRPAATRLVVYLLNVLGLSTLIIPGIGLRLPLT
jgi:hypothetical protein